MLRDTTLARSQPTMTASKACATERSPRSALEQLAPELLHCILGYLPLEDVLTLRRTCIILSSVGLDYFDTEVPLVSHYDKFRALKEIAKHPMLSMRMKSLFYMCDRPHDVRDRAWKNSWSARQNGRGISESSDPHIAASFQSYLELCETYGRVGYQEHERPSSQLADRCDCDRDKLLDKLVLFLVVAKLPTLPRDTSAVLPGYHR